MTGAGVSLDHSRLLVVLGLLLLALPARSKDQPRLAVLEFEVQNGISIDRRTFSSRLQNAARKAAPHLFVMTQSNIEVLLRGASKDLGECEGECVVDTGRRIGADIVIAGRISKVGSTLAISMQMHETARGLLLAGEDVSARSADELLGVLETAADRLLSTLHQTSVPPRPRRATLLIRANVEVFCSAFDPDAYVADAPQPRARTGSDGVARLDVDASSVRVTCAAAGHDDASATVNVTPGTAAPLQLFLRPSGSTVDSANGAVDQKSGLRFITIPAGTFQFGRQTVTLKAFKFGETATTVKAYTRCVRAGACEEAGRGDACNFGTARAAHPINCLDWHQAQSFCRWIGGRLPSEEQREYVAAGGDEGRTYPWGNNGPDARACWSGEGNAVRGGHRKTTCPVGTHKAGDSKWGLRDLAGNVWEWTSSNYAGDSYLSPKVIRGGSWAGAIPEYLRALHRDEADPSLQSRSVGFRCEL